MLYIIGAGLNDHKDITLRGLEILQACDLVYIESYTSMYNKGGCNDLEKIIQKEIIKADRKMVEESMEIVEQARDKSVAFVVYGTPLFATTHMDIYIRAKKNNVETLVLHNSSILNAFGAHGLCPYNHGRTVSIPYFTETCKFMSFYDNIVINWSNKMHTLCLLDIKTDENRFMSANEAIKQLIYCESVRKKRMFTDDKEILVIARFTGDDEIIKFGKVKDLVKMDFGKPLHSMVIPGEINPVEREFLDILYPKSERS